MVKYRRAPGVSYIVVVIFIRYLVKSNKKSVGEEELIAGSTETG